MSVHTGTRQETDHARALSETPIFDEILSRNGIAWQDEDGDPPAAEGTPTPSAAD